MVDLLEIMKRQSGPYRASETLDMNDALHITGVLYAGKPAILRFDLHRLTYGSAGSETVRMGYLRCNDLHLQYTDRVRRL